MIDAERDSDWYVTIYLDGRARLTRAGEREAEALRVELGLGPNEPLSVMRHGHAVRVRDKVMIVGGEHLLARRAA